MSRRLSIIGLSLALWAPAAWAQQGAIEVTPFLGNLSAAAVDATRGSVREFGPSGGFAWGGAVSYNLGDNSAMELQWTRNRGELEADGVPRFGLRQDVVHVQFLVLVGDPIAHVRPYVLGGAGASLMKPRRSGVDDLNRFSLSLGAGAKVFLTDAFGLRAQARYVATFVNDEPRGHWCDPTLGCLYVDQAAFLDQGEYTIGLVFRY